MGERLALSGESYRHDQTLKPMFIEMFFVPNAVIQAFGRRSFGRAIGIREASIQFAALGVKQRFATWFIGLFKPNSVCFGH